MTKEREMLRKLLDSMQFHMPDPHLVAEAQALLAEDEPVKVWEPSRSGCRIETNGMVNVKAERDEAQSKLEEMRKGDPVAWLYKGEPWFDGDNWHDSIECACSKQVAKFKDENARPLFLAVPKVPHVDALAQHIRKIDGSNTLGAGALAEAIVEYINATPESKEGERNEDPEIVIRLTAAIREADMKFDHVGGATRHYVRDCLLPALAKQGLRITDVQRVDICDG